MKAGRSKGVINAIQQNGRVLNKFPGRIAVAA